VSFGLLLLAFSIFLSSASEGLWALEFAALIGYPLAVLVGVPAYILLEKNGQRGFGAYLGLSVILSVIVNVIFVLSPVIQESKSVLPELTMPARIMQVLILTAACVFSVLAFWFIARPGKFN